MNKLVNKYLLIAIGLVSLMTAVWGVPADLPVFTPIGSREVAYGETLTFSVTAKDPANKPIFYEAANLPDGATLQPRSGLFIWSPTINQLGTYRVTFAAWDRFSPQRMANETVVMRVVYRKVYSSKGWGIGAGEEKELIATTDVADLYPVVSALEINGQACSLTQEVFPAAARAEIKVKVTSFFNIKKKTVVALIDGEKVRRAAVEDIQNYGDGQIVALTLKFALPDLAPGKHSLQIKAGNELSVTRQEFGLTVQ
jgi:hypothetical protein